MPTLTRKDELVSLIDATLISAGVFIRSKHDGINDAEVKRLMLQRMNRLATQRAMRSVDPNLHSRITISMTGSV